jgi:hypothetical protein
LPIIAGIELFHQKTPNELILCFCIATISLMEFRNPFSGEKLPPADVPNSMVQRRIIRYFTTAAKLQADELKPENPNNPIQQINENVPHLTKGEDAEFIKTLGKGGYDELSTHLFRDIVGENSPLARSEEKRIDDMQTIMADPILSSIGMTFETFYRHVSQGNLNIDPELIEIAKQKAINRLMINDRKHDRKFYEDKFRRFLYLHYGPAMVYSEQYRLLLQEAGINFPRANREADYWEKDGESWRRPWEEPQDEQIPDQKPGSTGNNRDPYGKPWEEPKNDDEATARKRRSEQFWENFDKQWGQGHKDTKGPGSSGREQANPHTEQTDWRGAHRRPLTQRELEIRGHLATLGLPEDTDVDHMPLPALEAAAKKGYRAGAKKHHPDAKGEAVESDEQRTRDMADLNKAHDAIQAIIKERKKKEELAS